MNQIPVEDVLVVEQFGQRDGAGAFVPATVNGMNAQFLNPPPNGTFTSLVSMLPGTNDVFLGDLAAIVYGTNRRWQFGSDGNIALPAGYAQKAYQKAFSAIEFATYDPELGTRRSNPIRFGSIRQITASTPLVRTPRGSVFHIAYNNVNNVTYKGDSAKVSISLHGGDPQFRKPVIIQRYIGGSYQNPNNLIPATAADIQQAHFDLLEGILETDPNEVYFDKLQSRLNSAASGYTAVYVMGAYRGIDRFSDYDKFRTVSFQLSLGEEGFKNLLADEDFDINNFNNSYTLSRSYLCRSWLPMDNGAGYPEQVRWHESRVVGNRGSLNRTLWPDVKNYLTNPNIWYSTVCIDYTEQMSSQEYTHKVTDKKLTIYIAFLDGRGPVPLVVPPVVYYSSGTYGLVGFNISGGGAPFVAVPYPSIYTLPSIYNLTNLAALVNPLGTNTTQGAIDANIANMGNAGYIGGVGTGVNPNTIPNANYNTPGGTSEIFYAGINSEGFGNGGVPQADFITNINKALTS